MSHQHLSPPIEPAAAGAAALCELLRLVGTAAVLLDAAGAVVGVSAAAHACIGAGLTLRNRRLAAEDPAGARALNELIHKVLRPGGAPANAPVVVAWRKERPLIVRAVTLDVHTRRSFQPAHAMVVVLDTACTTLPDERQLAAIFGLSCGEARIALRLAAGDSLETAAHVCGISYETARKRIKAAFDKTATHRQAELVALLIRIGSISPHADQGAMPQPAAPPGLAALLASARWKVPAARPAARPSAQLARA